MNEIYSELTEIIEKQNELIAELINDNAEKENMINELLRGQNFLKKTEAEYG